MVIILNAHERTRKDNKPFVSLELSGDIELVQSQATGRFYATVRKTFISTTFDLETAKSFIGQKLPGNIHRVECDPYEFIVPEAGEQIELAHRWEYQPEEFYQPVETRLLNPTAEDYIKELAGND